MPHTQGCGGDQGQEEQDEQHHGQDDQGVLTGAAGEGGSYQCGVVKQLIAKQGPGQVLCAQFKDIKAVPGSGSPAREPVRSPVREPVRSPERSPANPAGSSISEAGQAPLIL